MALKKNVCKNCVEKSYAGTSFEFLIKEFEKEWLIGKVRCPRCITQQMVFNLVTVEEVPTGCIYKVEQKDNNGEIKQGNLPEVREKLDKTI